MCSKFKPGKIFVIYFILTTFFMFYLYGCGFVQLTIHSEITGKVESITQARMALLVKLRLDYLGK